jgi:hypothetical protein
LQDAHRPMKKPAIPKKTVKRSPKAGKGGASASKLIDARIKELNDWRGETLARMRALVRQADPDVVEEWKWDVPVWSHAGIVCTGETYRKAVKLTFAKGAALDDPARLFNASLGGNTRRAIDIHEGDAIDEAAFKALVRGAVALNVAGKKQRAG